METRKVPKWLIIFFILYSVLFCSLGSAYIFSGGLLSLPFVSLFHNVKVVDSVLCSGPTENFDLSDLSTFKPPNALSELFYCAYFEIDNPAYVAIDWYFEDEKYSFATSPLQRINESGYYYFSLMDSLDYSDHFFNQYDGEFNLENHISDGSFRIYVFNRRMVIREDIFHFQMNP